MPCTSLQLQPLFLLRSVPSPLLTHQSLPTCKAKGYKQLRAEKSIYGLPIATSDRYRLPTSRKLTINPTRIAMPTESSYYSDAYSCGKFHLHPGVTGQPVLDCVACCQRPFSRTISLTSVIPTLYLTHFLSMHAENTYRARQ